MLNIFLKTYWREIFFSTLFFGIYAFADLSLFLVIGIISTGKFLDQDLLINSSINSINVPFLIITFILIRYLILRYSSLIGYKKIFDIYEKIGINSIYRITCSPEINSRFLKPGFMQKHLSKDIDFIVTGFLIPLTALFIELVIFTIIATIVITKLGLIDSILLGTVSFLTFLFILKRSSKINKFFGTEREIAEEEKIRTISLIQSSLFDIFSYSSSKYVVNLFKKANKFTRKITESVSHTLILSRVSFETFFCIMICFFFLLGTRQNPQFTNNYDETFKLILAFSIRLIPGFGRILQSTQQVAYTWPCFKEFFSNNKISRDIKFKKENVIINKNKKLLEIKNDSLYRKKNKIIDINRFEIKEGSWTTISGESGSGKSTLLEAIFILSNKVNSRNLNVAFMPQTNSLISNNIYESISLSEKYNKKIIEEILIELGLKSLIDRSDNNGYLDFDSDKVMSGGQLQRVIIARTLYHKKNFLILDEFTSSLDKEYELKVLNILKRKQLEQGITILCSSHRDVILKFTDEIYNISQKKLNNYI